MSTIQFPLFAFFPVTIVLLFQGIVFSLLVLPSPFSLLPSPFSLLPFPFSLLLHSSPFSLLPFSFLSNSFVVFGDWLVAISLLLILFSPTLFWLHTYVDVK